MATKNNPGEFDCYAEAADDEPLFVLRANDELAPGIVSLWALIRSKATIAEMRDILDETLKIADQKPDMDQKKYREALECASAMIEWKQVHG